MLNRLFRRGSPAPKAPVVSTASPAYAHGPSIFGMLAEFDDSDKLLEAARKAQAAGFKHMDAYSPYPIEGLAEAVNFPRTRLPLVVLLGGLTGATGAFFLQAYSMGVDYPYNIGGRPLMSWPMFVPITFEGTILFAAFSAGIGLIVACGLPQLYHPAFNAPNFERASQDRFFLQIDATDPQYDRSKTKQFLESLGAQRVSEVEN